jgi:hypothetical protein
MKNLVALFTVLFLFGLTSCSDVNDNSLLTNPVMEKSSLPSNEEITPSPVSPYPYLNSFSKVEKLSYVSSEGGNAIEFYIPEGSAKFAHLYVVVNFVQGIGLPIAPKMYFIDQIFETSFKIEGIRLDQVQNLSVYGFELNGSSEGIYPFINNSAMNEVSVKGWKLEKSNIKVECSGTWPSSLKYVYAEIDSKTGSRLVFLQRPSSTSFIIPQYGTYGVSGLKLFGYHTVMEGE